MPDRAAYIAYMGSGAFIDPNPYAVGATRELDSLALFCNAEPGSCPGSLYRSAVLDHLFLTAATFGGIGAASLIGRGGELSGGSDLAALDEVTAERDLARLSCGGMSFTAGTKVLLASGLAVPIATLKPGDKVLAVNTRTGKTQAEPVTAVLVHRDTNRYDLRLRTAQGIAVIHTTSTHLFWDPYLDQFIPAKQLKSGEHLKTADRQSAMVVGGSTVVSRLRGGWR